MFTGIIQAVCPVRWLEDSAESRERKLAIETPFTNLVLGESIAINGACLTVSKFDNQIAQFHLSPETISKTSLGSLVVESKVNLERALCAGDSLSGHLVQGHVDGLGTINEIREDGDSWHVTVNLSPELRRYCVDKGSITIDGTSLTINKVDDDSGTIQLQIIPHTWKETIFSEYKTGDSVNVEVDVIAKYVERQCSPYKKP